MNNQLIFNGILTVPGQILIYCGVAVAIIGIVMMYVGYPKDNTGIERSGDIAFRIGQALFFLGEAFIAETLVAAIPCIILFVVISVRLLIYMKG